MEISVLQKIVEEKEKEIQNTAETLREARMENKKLLTEIETPKPNERLLAAIESDKVAAAKAVSQNQKLKTQVVELEEAFMKLVSFSVIKICYCNLNCALGLTIVKSRNCINIFFKS